MEFNLEFRSKSGDYLFGLHGDFAKTTFRNLDDCPEFIKKTRGIEGKGEFVTLECIALAGYKLGGVIEIIMKPGDYVKAFNK
jgi:hypothetical protein